MAKRPSKMDTGAPPPRMKPGDFVTMPSRNGPIVAIVTALYPSAGATIKLLDVWIGAADDGEPVVMTISPTGVEPYTGEIRKLT